METETLRPRPDCGKATQDEEGGPVVGSIGGSNSLTAVWCGGQSGHAEVATEWMPNRAAAVAEWNAGRVHRRFESAPLQCWFELSYASWLTLPRVLMEAMPLVWQDRMAALLNEYREAFPNQPDIGTRVQVTQGDKLIKTPEWLINYRRPNRAKINELRRTHSADD